MKIINRLLILILSFCWLNSLQAYHSNAASYIDERITVEGTVDRYLFRNPHVVVYFNVTDDSGETVRWMSEGAAATGLRLAGWDEDTLSKGEIIRITGRAGRNNKPMMSLSDVAKIDASTGAVIANINLERTVIVPNDPTSPDFSYPATRADGTVNLTGVWTQWRRV